MNTIQKVFYITVGTILGGMFSYSAFAQTSAEHGTSTYTPPATSSASSSNVSNSNVSNTESVSVDADMDALMTGDSSFNKKEDSKALAEKSQVEAAKGEESKSSSNKEEASSLKTSAKEGDKGASDTALSTKASAEAATHSSASTTKSEGGWFNSWFGGGSKKEEAVSAEAYKSESASSTGQYKDTAGQYQGTGEFKTMEGSQFKGEGGMGDAMTHPQYSGSETATIPVMAVPSSGVQLGAPAENSGFGSFQTSGQVSAPTAVEAPTAVIAAPEAPSFQYQAPEAFMGPSPAGAIQPDTSSFQAPAPTVDTSSFQAPAPTMEMQAPTVDTSSFQAPAPTVEFQAPAPTVEFQAPAPTVEMQAPQPMGDGGGGGGGTPPQ